MRNFNKEDFTEDELYLLKIVFTLADTAIELQRQDNYDVYWSNTFFHLKEKLGLGDIV